VLKRLRRRARTGQLARCVVRKALESESPPNFLYASNRAGRFNAAGTECVYWSEDDTIARLEYNRNGYKLQAYTTFFCLYKLAIIDLEDPLTLDAFELTKSDLHTTWRLAFSPTKCQTLGQAVSLQQRFDAIRFPSDAVRVAKTRGCNLVIFKASLRDPHFIQVVTDPTVPVQRWP
jgi:RES domain-containing protein